MGGFVVRRVRLQRRVVGRLLLILGLAGVGIPLFLPRGRAVAQWIPSSGWTAPFNVSSSVTASNDPTIVADPYGLVHVFWSEDLGGEPLPEGQTPGVGNTIMYRRLGPDGWTEAVDIFYAGELKRMGQPAAVVDRNGYLNLVWIELDGLYYSYAPSWKANQPQAWAEPIKIEEGTLADAKLLDLGDRQLVVYSVIAGANQGLLAAVLTDRWPQEYATVWHGAGGTAPQNIAATVDKKGRIHLAWEVTRPPSPVPFELWYGSSDGTRPLQFDNRLVTKSTSDETSLQFARPWVAVRGEDEVHLQWAQGSSTHRWHQYSTDGGKNWIQPYQIWPDLISQTGSQAAGTDSADTLYWVDVFRYPSGAYLTYWTEHGWERPEMFYLKYLTPTDKENENFNVHYIRMAISQGNQLHIVFLDLERGEVWHMQKPLPAPALVSRPLPTDTATPLPPPAATSVPEAAVSLTPRVTIVLPAGAGAPTDQAFGPGTWVMVGLVPVFLLLAVVVVTKLKTR
jgi:hypothetical protein